MEYNVVIMPKGRKTGIGGRLVIESEDSHHQTLIIIAGEKNYRPEDVEWVFGFSRKARIAIQKAGYKTRRDIDKVMWIEEPGKLVHAS